MQNLKKLSEGYRKEAIASLQEFVHCESVYDGKTIEEGAPYGKGVKKALDCVFNIAKNLGFKVDTCKGYATEISYGNEGKLIGIYAHGDVVPTSGKWDNPPFGAKIVGTGKDAKMIGRGTSDDKGPAIAALYAMKMLKDNDLLNGFRVRLVIGGDEERGASCLANYFHKLNKEQADYAFTPDAEFPLIYAEKAISRLKANRVCDLKPVIAFDGGVVANAVCDKLVVTLPKDEKFIAYLTESGVKFDSSIVGDIMIVTFKGKSAHGSTPELGENAAFIGWRCLGAFYDIALLSDLAKAFEDPNGKSFGGYSYAKELGKSTFCVGITKYDGKNLMVTVDYRYGEGIDPTIAQKALEEATHMGFELQSGCDALLYDKNSALVSTLMKSYKRTTKRIFDKPLAIGGGTYAKEAKNTVAYGSAFKNHPGDIHSPNEYIYLDDLVEQIYIYADAILSLGGIR